MKNRSWVGALAAAIVPLVAAAESNPKDAYDLFNPTPREEMREFVTDRPDRTEAAYTVDAGHFQVEADIVADSRDRSSSSTDDDFAFMVANLKVGLTNNVDLQVIPESYVYQRERPREGGEKTSRSGFGDTVTRLKVNLWGNDGGPSAVAVMPFVKFPTNRNNVGNDDVEGGVIVPWDVAISDEWGVAGMVQVNVNRDENSSGYHPAFIQSVTVGQELVEDLAGYVELYGERATEEGAEWIVTADGGLVYTVSPDLLLDAGVNVGVTDAAPDLNPFLGFSYRY
jgi:hypothetical protein